MNPETDYSCFFKYFSNIVVQYLIGLQEIIKFEKNRK